MVMDLYYAIASPPCRAVAMTAEILGLELNKKTLNRAEGEHLQPAYLALNPQHTIPTLVDGDFSVWESRAIMVYLVEKYGKKDNDLYPSCVKKQALINQRLYFDMGTIYKTIMEYYVPQYMGKQPANPDLLKKMEDALDLLNTFLEGNQYVTGSTLTLADLSLFASVSVLEVAGYDFNKQANVARWYKQMNNAGPWAEENRQGSLALKQRFGL